MAADPFLLGVAQGEALTITTTMIDDGSIASWSLSAFLRDSAGAAVYTLTPTITDNGSTSSPGKFTTALTAAQTAALTAKTLYQFSAWRTNSGSEAQLVIGSLAVSGVGESPFTALGSYATPYDLVKTHDYHDIGAYAADDGSEISLAQILAPDANVAFALLWGSGDIEAACLAGKRYSPTKLATLQGGAQALLKGLVCVRAYYHLAKRRLPDATKVAGFEETQELLKSLRAGDFVFGDQENADASVMKKVDLLTDSLSRERRPTELTSRFFGARMDNDRGG